MLIFRKTSNWAPDLEISVVGVFRHREHEYGRGKFQGTNLRFSEKSTCIPSIIHFVIFSSIYSWFGRHWNHIYPIWRSSGEIWIFLKIDHQLYIRWIFYYKIRVSDIKKPLYTQFQGQRSKLKYFWKSPCRPWVIHRVIF